VLVELVVFVLVVVPFDDDFVNDGTTNGVRSSAGGADIIVLIYSIIKNKNTLDAFVFVFMVMLSCLYLIVECTVPKNLLKTNLQPGNLHE